MDTARLWALWDTLPDLSFIQKIAFKNIDVAALATAIEVFKTATEQLDKFSSKRL